MDWRVWNDEKLGAVCVSFSGHLDETAGAESAKRFAAELGSKQTNIVFDISAMKSYDAKARGAWQEMLWPKRELIKSLSIIGGSPLVRMGAHMLGMALRAKVQNADSWDQLRVNWKAG